MNIHEYQAKALLHEFGVPISRGVPVLKASDSDAAAKTLPGPIWVVKSQIHAGGRGKGKFKEASAGDNGGVRIAKSVAGNVAQGLQLGSDLTGVDLAAVLARLGNVVDAHSGGQTPTVEGRAVETKKK